MSFYSRLGHSVNQSIFILEKYWPNEKVAGLTVEK
jgi:hypothetical protein